MTELYFLIDSRNFLYRTDTNVVKNQRDDQYVCHFIFENSDWDGVEKFVTYQNKRQQYTALLGIENECSAVIPFEALLECVLNIKIYGDDLSTRNQISLVVVQPKEEITYNCQTQESYHDVGVEAYQQVGKKFDDVKISGDYLVFYSDDKELVKVSLNEISKSNQADWIENDSDNPAFIKNKPDLINNFRYENNQLICLSDNQIKQTISLKHNHPSTDIIDFDDEVDIDLNNLLVSLTENIRSL